MNAAERAELVRERVVLKGGELWWKRSGRPVKYWTCRDGYKRFTITPKSRKTIKFAAHRVVWLLHYGEWPKLQIDHINRDPADNRIENLRDVSAAENGRNKEILRGRQIKQSMLTPCAVLYIISSGKRSADLARELGVSHQSVGAVRRGKTWSHLTAEIAA